MADDQASLRAEIRRAYARGWQAGYRSVATKLGATLPNATSASLAEHMRKEVEWYRSHGRWANRIRLTSDGHEYVIGDAAWSRMGYREIVEPQLRTLHDSRLRKPT